MMVVQNSSPGCPSGTTRLQKLTLLSSIFMVFMIVMLVSRVEDVLNSNPKAFLPPSMRRKFHLGFNFTAFQEIHPANPVRRRTHFAFNLTVIKEIQHNLDITNWQALQIFRPDVPKQSITFVNSIQNLKKLKQSDTVPQQSKCALIGNAGILYGSGCGDVIDKFNFVIRMNLAPSGGEFKDDVGSKVTLATINEEQLGRLISCTDSNYPPEWTCKNTDKICLENRRKKHPSLRPRFKCDDLLSRIKRLNGTTLWFFKDLESAYLGAVRRTLGKLEPNYNVSIGFAYSPVNPMKPASRKWHLEFPSSGIAIYAAASQFCEQISMFGFYPFSQDSKNRTVRHHYYEKGSKMNYTTNLHAMPKEYRIFTELNRTGAIHLVNECTPS